MPRRPRHVTRARCSRPAFYDRWIFPRYERILEPAVRAGRKIVFVSDGNIDVFLERLLELPIAGIMFENPATPYERVLATWGEAGRGFIGGIDTALLTARLAGRGGRAHARRDRAGPPVPRVRALLVRRSLRRRADGEPARVLPDPRPDGHSGGGVTVDRPLVLVNGVVRTMDARGTVASAVAARDGRIVFVGDDRGARDAVGTAPGGAAPRSSTSAGRACCPGSWTPTCTSRGTRAASRRSTRARAPGPRRSSACAPAPPRAPAGQWIGGSSWDHNEWDRLPSRQDLDAAAPRNPVALKAKSGHAMWVNSRAPWSARASARAPPIPRAGRSRGTPRASRRGSSTRTRWTSCGRSSPSGRRRRSRSRCARRSAARSPRGSRAFTTSTACRRLPRAAAPATSGACSTMRVLKGIPARALGEAVALGLRSGFGDDMLAVGQVKLFADGALGPQTAWMLEPYEGSTRTGIPTLTPEELRADIARARAAGLACAVHAIGDAAVRAVLDAFEAARGRAGSRRRASPAARPHRARAAHRARRPAAPGSPSASSRPCSRSTRRRTWTSPTATGERAAATAYAWRSVLAAGAALAFGSDCPVEDHRARSRASTPRSPGAAPTARPAPTGGGPNSG